MAEDEFERIAEDAKVNCPVSKALTGIPITLEARADLLIACRVAQRARRRSPLAS